MSYNKPLPVADIFMDPFWAAAREKRLAMPACDDCGHVHFPPGPVCPKCLSAALRWRNVSGKATLESWIDFHHVYWEGFRSSLPYRVCLVRLAEGPLLLSNLVPAAHEPSLGDGVHVVFDAVTDTVTLPKFELD